MRCSCGARFSAYHRNAMARASKAAKAWRLHFEARAALVEKFKAAQAAGCLCGPRVLRIGHSPNCQVPR